MLTLTLDPIKTPTAETGRNNSLPINKTKNQ
jgi:hypothetical protein